MDRDEEIIRGLKAGDNRAYEWLYQHHYRVLCRFADSLVGDAYVAETMVNDVIFSIWQRKATIDIRSLRRYLLRSVRNRCLNYLEELRRNQVFIDKYRRSIALDGAHMEPETPTPMEMLLEQELDLKIKDSLNAMPPLTAHIFSLSRFSRMKYEAIAQHTGVSIDVVKYHIKQALSKLRTDLKDYVIPPRR
ncbi:RNA polymerase sigma-70 factor, ECF subfamily [Parapedobacter composti]|uniref:RNA polymerase sigma-70 factor, ECF subfamily n=1 Tax=Parapedobacter composti TaxID=623281 RepID=A0A1I1ITQ6_9SPHI|nr:RNA polymerase sigma-70 factor [Parapedobacter composti]SFC39677.1 RNA polymerase sigma-70 factor, ECF subfamily [Parapedobacter composti]